MGCRMSVPLGWRSIRDPKLRLIRVRTDASHSLSAAPARCRRIFLACKGTISKAASLPVPGDTDAKYSSRKSCRYFSWPLMPS